MTDEGKDMGYLDAGEFDDEELGEILREAEELLKDGDYDGAVEKLQEAAEQAPESPLPRHNQSVVHLMRLMEDYSHEELWEDLADDEGAFEAAVSEAEAALEIDGDFVPARNNLGRLFAVRGWWENAIEQWEISLSTYADQPQVRKDLAEARRHIGT